MVEALSQSEEPTKKASSIQADHVVCQSACRSCLWSREMTGWQGIWIIWRHSLRLGIGLAVVGDSIELLKILCKRSLNDVLGPNFSKKLSLRRPQKFTPRRAKDEPRILFGQGQQEIN